MPIPDYQSCMLPLLRFAADGNEHQLKDAAQALAGQFSLSEQELSEFLPSGQQPVFINRLGWARTYMKKAGLLRNPRRGYFQITDRGLSVLRDGPAEIDVKYLERFPEFIEFRSPKKDGVTEEGEESIASDSGASQTPNEALELAYERLRTELASEILQTLKGADPSLFENIVVELLVKMGYGGSRKDAGKAIGRSGDEGIDGIIKEDHLGLDNIYIQAKRWDATIGRPEIQKFAGALQGQRARKGIFITTSDFSREANEYVSKIDSKIVLIDGKSLARLMIDFGVGVTSVAIYEVKKIDSDYFAED
ncbi:restriction endonuclease [Povalibacter sp.]|uniref:restriction endonuclease n=1 Tax=Povalibacter sp. TaxID=1962978 RepID=UPI0032C244BE